MKLRLPLSNVIRLNKKVPVTSKKKTKNLICLNFVRSYNIFSFFSSTYLVELYVSSTYYFIFALLVRRCYVLFYLERYFCFLIKIFWNFYFQLVELKIEFGSNSWFIVCLVVISKDIKDRESKKKMCLIMEINSTNGNI